MLRWLQSVTVQGFPDARRRSRAIGGVLRKVGDRYGSQFCQLLVGGKCSSCVLATEIGFEFLQLLHRFDDFSSLFRLRSQAAFFSEFGPWGFGIDQEREHGFAGALGGFDFEPGGGALAVAAEFFGWDVAVSVGDDA